MFRKFSLYLFLISGLVVWSCSQHRTGVECRDGDEQPKADKVFVMGDSLVKTDQLDEIIRFSKLNIRGYSIILTAASEMESTPVNDLVDGLNYFKAHANHVIGIADTTTITNANRMAISHAQIIFLDFVNREAYNSFLSDTLLVNSVQQASNRGVPVIGIGAGAGLLGEVTITSTPEPASGQTEITTLPGLGLMRGTLVDEADLFNNFKTQIENFAAKHPYLFVGSGNNSFLRRCSDQLMIINPEDLMVIENGKLLFPEQISGKTSFKLPAHVR